MKCVGEVKLCGIAENALKLTLKDFKIKESCAIL